jgi:putative ATP-dependent endonuclease of OLD family
MSKGKAFSLRKGETQLDDEDYVFLEKFLDVTKSNLFFAKGVLIVEGDGENILLPTIAKLIGRPLENYGVSVVNVGNTAYARYAKIFKRKGMDENRDKWIPIKAVCLRDVDLWPDKAEEKPENEPFGFKEKKLPDPAKKKRGNLDYWKSTYNPTELAKKIASRKSIGGQNVKVVLSDEWTFEYSLALKGLAYEVYEAVRGSKEGFSDLPEDIEERAISIYKLVEEDKAKTKVAYELVNILSRDYQGSVGCEQLISKLPTYIIEAIEYVTEPL